MHSKPQVLLTATNRDHFVRVSLTVLDIFLDAITNTKKLICVFIAQNLKQVSLIRVFKLLAMVFNLLQSNLT